MRAIGLRTLVTTIGLVIAIVVAISVPLGYLFVGYSNTAETVAFKARLNSSRLAKYIYTHNTLWQYQRVRLAELIELPEANEIPIRQRIIDAQGKLVLAEGASLTPPFLTRSAPIVVAGSVIGRLEVDTSLRHIVDGAAIAAAFSCLLGLGMYFAIRIFPLRLIELEDAKNRIQAINVELQTQNVRFDAALSNMAQGLCLFDDEQRLVISNPRFADIFRIPADKIVPGMLTRELVQFAEASPKDLDAALAEQRRLIDEAVSDTVIVTLTDDRIVLVSHRAMKDGGFVATFDDITERRRAEDRIAHMARHDALTDLPNRLFFREKIEKVLGRMRSGERLAVLSLDLDRFKGVNDTLGHPIGDMLLQLAADSMRTCVREDDIIARLGGDEFAFVQVPTRQTSDATALAARLIEVLSVPYDLNDHQVIVGASIGIAFAPDDGTSSDQLIKSADLALYRAKADGGGTYRCFEPQMDAHMQARRVLELDLRQAIMKCEFELFYQPLVSLKTGQITALEALLRWHHPARGMVHPMEFIPLAEETGLIVPLGEWVLREACREAARWPADVTISVNLSPAQFKSRNLVQAVVSALAASGLAAARLQLEITELVMLQETEGTLATLHQLRDLGVKITMDDFGTGYSSLGYLRRFPFDKIKIDKSFICDLPTKQDSLAIVRAVVGLGNSLGITTTAEGVETIDQLECLQMEGCTEFQGFLFSPPRPAEEVRTLLAELKPEAKAVA